MDNGGGGGAYKDPENTRLRLTIELGNDNLTHYQNY